MIIKNRFFALLLIQSISLSFPETSPASDLFFDRLSRAFEAFKVPLKQADRSPSNFSESPSGGGIPASTMRSNGCGDLTRKICKSKHTGVCEAVYVASENASAECKEKSPQNIENVCGDRNAKLFSSDSECVAPVTALNCPLEITEIKQTDVERLANCPSVQLPLCKEVCGVRYDYVDIRNFYQTDRKPGVTCIDGSDEDMRNGVAYSEDPIRKSCTENHQGNAAWCVSYNKSFNGVKFGAFVQCVGKTK